MKKFIALCMVGVAGLANAGLVDSVATAGWETKPTKRYKLEMYGFDARAYEFTSENGLKCVAVYSGGSQGGFQMQCISAK